MERLNLPPFDIALERRADKLYVWDVLRQSWIRLTPEEWVRQHFVHYLVGELGYPPQLMMNEVPISLGDKQWRCDTLLYTRQIEPRMIIEYKAPTVPLSQRVLRQIIQYNYALRAPYLVLSNGMQHLVYEIDLGSQSYVTLDAIPHYEQLVR